MYFTVFSHDLQQYYAIVSFRQTWRTATITSATSRNKKAFVCHEHSFSLFCFVWSRMCTEGTVVSHTDHLLSQVFIERFETIFLEQACRFFTVWIYSVFTDEPFSYPKCLEVGNRNFPILSCPCNESRSVMFEQCLTHSRKCPCFIKDQSHFCVISKLALIVNVWDFLFVTSDNWGVFMTDIKSEVSIFQCCVHYIDIYISILVNTLTLFLTLPFHFVDINNIKEYWRN